jgi:rfaE bifunctional protein nucleotidyltransferase chain/domain
MLNLALLPNNFPTPFYRKVKDTALGNILTVEAAQAERLLIRAIGGTLVFTNGHFDLLHVGHLDYLEKARALGDALFIGLNGDASTARLKGEGRPLIPAIERARLLAALQPITGVIIFEADTADELIRALQPDVYVKGGDYANKTLPERPTVEAYGGRVALIDYLPDHSTSALIAKIKALP